MPGRSSGKTSKGSGRFSIGGRRNRNKNKKERNEAVIMVDGGAYRKPPPPPPLRTPTTTYSDVDESCFVLMEDQEYLRDEVRTQFEQENEEEEEEEWTAATPSVMDR